MKTPPIKAPIPASGSDEAAKKPPQSVSQKRDFYQFITGSLHSSRPMRLLKDALAFPSDYAAARKAKKEQLLTRVFAAYRDDLPKLTQVEYLKQSRDQSRTAEERRHSFVLAMICER